MNSQSEVSKSKEPNKPTSKAASADVLSREITSKSLEAILEGRDLVENSSSVVQAAIDAMQGPSVQAAIKAAMGPSNAIEKAMASSNTVQAAIDAMQGSTVQAAIKAAMGPSNAIEKAMASSDAVQAAIDQIQNVSLSNTSLVPRARMTSRVSRTDFHPLHNVAELGRAIRRARKCKHLTQQSFADLAGVGRRFVSELEQGKQTLQIDKVLMVAAAAGIQVMFIPTDTDT